MAHTQRQGEAHSRHIANDVCVMSIVAQRVLVCEEMPLVEKYRGYVSKGA